MAERFLRLLCSLGIIKMIQDKQWHGPGHPKNRAALYRLPKDEVVAFNVRWLTTVGRGETKGGSIYITDKSVSSVPALGALVPEIERLNRPWKPQYHSSG
jgi:hypothetical protein